MNSVISRSSTDLLIVFVKNPIIGKVKSRLSSDIGKTNAYSIYRHLVERTQNAVKSLKCNKVVFYSDFVDFSDNWENNNYHKLKQNGRDIGERMQNAFHWAFSNNYRKVILVGSDIYYLNDRIIDHAFKALSSNDVAIGPTYDGGYYLIGMKKNNPGIFDNINWSSEEVYGKTVKLCKIEKLIVKSMDKLVDVDTVKDFDLLKPIDRCRITRFFKKGIEIVPG